VVVGALEPPPDRRIGSDRIAGYAFPAPGGARPAGGVTGAAWNRYFFRTGRNSSQDAISNTVALGRDGIAAFKEALAGTPAELVAEEYAPTDTTAFGERIFNALKDLDGEKRVFIIIAGANNPMSKLQAMAPGRFGIELATGGNILEALKAYKEFPGMEGAAYYYYEIPQNPVNDWLVKEHMARFGTPPDFFTAGGMSAGIAAVEALKKAGSTDTEALITAMEGMEFETPKGKMIFRPEDHQALQAMYHFKIKVDPNVEWGIPELVREIPIEDMNIPIRNTR